MSKQLLSFLLSESWGYQTLLLTMKTTWTIYTTAPARLLAAAMSSTVSIRCCKLFAESCANVYHLFKLLINIY